LYFAAEEVLCVGYEGQGWEREEANLEPLTARLCTHQLMLLLIPNANEQSVSLASLLSIVGSQFAYDQSSGEASQAALNSSYPRSALLGNNLVPLDGHYWR